MRFDQPQKQSFEIARVWRTPLMVLSNFLFALPIPYSIEIGDFYRKTRLKWICTRLILSNRYPTKTVWFYYDGLQKLGLSSPAPALLQAVVNYEEYNVEIFLKRGADPNLRWGGVSLLFYALATQKRGVVRLLLEAGANPDVTYPFTSDKPLFWATREQNLETVRLLLEFGANVDTFGYSGLTSLTFAAGSGYTEIVRVLVEAGANPLIKAKDDRDSLAYARIYDHHEIIEIIQSRTLTEAVPEIESLRLPLSAKHWSDPVPTQRLAKRKHLRSLSLRKRNRKAAKRRRSSSP
ncbi:MAG: ankyrin repeat domain-containing protein [Chthonomonadaceae bacterium]|nr:ankyrin repeat domain-containing protein [Chthonomonadaceae bacterium]